MTLSIKIDNFQGPFDLLLHLIKKNKMSIYDIKIHEITNQYLQYINEMKELDLEITSEFIVIAATLLEIKSKYLLPKNKKEEEKEETEEDPRKDLVEKLILYKKFKLVSEFLKDKQISIGDIYTKKPEIIEEKDKEFNIDEVLKNVTMLKLFNLYSKLIKDYYNKMNTNTIDSQIKVDKFKIEDKMNYIQEIISKNENVTFSNIANNCSCKIEVIVSFLALLELIKLKEVRIYQKSNFDEIFIKS